METPLRPRYRLLWSPTSPYVRRVTVFAHETGLINDLDLVQVDPWSAQTDLSGQNPLGKIPVLLMPDGQTLPDSLAICDTLDRLHDGPKLVPEGEHRLACLRWTALGDGLTGALVATLLDKRYRVQDAGQAWWLARQAVAINRTLDGLETEATALEKVPVCLGHIVVATALGWMDFRFPHQDWRENHPDLSRWFDGFARRPAMVATVPRPVQG